MPAATLTLIVGPPLSSPPFHLAHFLFLPYSLNPSSIFFSLGSHTPARLPLTLLSLLPPLVTPPSAQLSLLPSLCSPPTFSSHPSPSCCCQSLDLVSQGFQVPLNYHRVSEHPLGTPASLSEEFPPPSPGCFSF